MRGAASRGSASRSGCWWTARRADHELVLRGRLEGQAPDIDPLVYLTDCDPSELTPGQFISAEIVGSRGYDLVARLSKSTALAGASSQPCDTLNGVTRRSKTPGGLVPTFFV